MFEQIVLGAIQGVTEWIPVSSKTCVMLTKMYLFKSPDSTNDLLKYALFLHLGTLVAATVYFWDDIKNVIQALIKPGDAQPESKKLLTFLLFTTVLTGLGLLFNYKFASLTQGAQSVKLAVTGLIAGLLIITGFLQIKIRPTGKRSSKDLLPADGIVLGLAQALATMPGLSRAGTTMAALSWRNFDKEHTLKLSFLMSLPAIFVGNIVMNYKMLLTFNSNWIGVIASFVVGILSIRTIMAFAKRVNFGWFMVFIGAILGSMTLLTLCMGLKFID